MKFRYLGLFALAPVLSQCQPACAPIPDDTTPVVEETVPAPVDTAAPVVVPDTTQPPATTQPPVTDVPQFHMDIQPIGGSEVCTGEVFYNDGTGTFDLVTADGAATLAPGEMANVPWTTLPPVSGGGRAIIFRAFAVTPGNPAVPPETLINSATLLKTIECPNVP